MDIQQYMQQLGAQARAASRQIATTTTAERNRALLAIRAALAAQKDAIQAANQLDLAAGRDSGLDAALLDRLAIDDKTFAGMLEGLSQVAALPDPIGEISEMKYRPTGIQIGKMRVPLGVVGIIYESRPNVTVEAASLCLKSGNACILRGGKEAIHSNTAIAKAVAAGLADAGLNAHAVQVLETTDRTAVDFLIAMPEFVDVIVPRGGRGLIERISNNAKVPVIKHLDGICHVYVDEQADLAKAETVAFNAKCHRYGVCNAMETLLVHAAVAQTFLPQMAAVYATKDVELRGCARVQAILPNAVAATEEDWSTEYLGPILSIKVVDSMEEAIEHINRYGSHHTDAIITENFTKARAFLTAVDSGSVMVNASTRFADGFEYGFGAEIGISTDKFHARGPVGLEGLTSQKYVVFGDGHIRQ